LVNIPGFRVRQYRFHEPFLPLFSPLCCKIWLEFAKNLGQMQRPSEHGLHLSNSFCRSAVYGLFLVFVGSPVLFAQAAKPQQPQLGDGAPISATALLADSIFYGFGTAVDRAFAGGKNSVIGISFDGAKFDIKGEKGEIYTFPITGAFKVNDRIRVDYEIPLRYVKLPDSEPFQGGLAVDVPINVVISSNAQPWSWDMTPALAFAEAGSKEWIGGGALTNLVTYRFKNIALAYGNYLSFFEGHRWTSDDVNFEKRVSQQMMKNGLKITAQFRYWVFNAYGIYSDYFQSAAISSYFTIGGEIGRYFIWSYKGIPVDLGFLSVGFYTEQGNRFSSGHLQFASAWRF
jgi:hypothetical protein